VACVEFIVRLFKNKTFHLFTCQVSFYDRYILQYLVKKNHIPDDGKYEVEWKNGKLQGQGTLALPDGREYIGGLRNELPRKNGLLHSLMRESVGGNYNMIK